MRLFVNLFWDISRQFDKISFEGNKEIFFPNKSISEIHLATLITSLSSSDSALLIESAASDQAWPIFDTIMLGSKFTCK